MAMRQEVLKVVELAKKRMTPVREEATSMKNRHSTPLIAVLAF